MLRQKPSPHFPSWVNYLLTKCSALNGTSLSTSPPELMEHQGRGAERVCEQEDGEEWCETLLSGHGVAIVLVSSLELWLPAHNQVNTDPSAFRQAAL